MPRRTPGRGALLHGCHGPARTVGALGHPDALRRPPEQPSMLGPSQRELKPDALVAREQREKAVGRGGGDRLDASAVLQSPERGHDVAADVVEQPMQARQALAPELHQRQEIAFARRVERALGFVAGEEPLAEERLHLADEGRARELIGQHGRDAQGERRGDALGLQRAELLDQRKVGIERGLAEPVTAMGPAAVVEHPGQVTVQGEDEVHRSATASRPAPRPGDRPRGTDPPIAPS